MDSDQERLLFRMNHIVPRGLSSTAKTSLKIDNRQISTELTAEAFEIQMTWGKVAGRLLSLFS